MGHYESIFGLSLLAYGKKIGGIEPQGMIQIWLIAGYHICKMYSLRIKSREGVG